jgi:hypothetical protein
MRLEGGPRQSLSIDDERVGSTTSSGPCVCEMERSDWLMVTFSTDVELSMTMVPHVRTCIVPVIDPLKAQVRKCSTRRRGGGELEGPLFKLSKMLATLTGSLAVSKRILVHSVVTTLASVLKYALLL